jgi:hypothetical protein
MHLALKRPRRQNYRKGLAAAQAAWPRMPRSSPSSRAARPSTVFSLTTAGKAAALDLVELLGHKGECYFQVIAELGFQVTAMRLTAEEATKRDEGLSKQFLNQHQ